MVAQALDTEKLIRSLRLRINANGAEIEIDLGNGRRVGVSGAFGVREDTRSACGAAFMANGVEALKACAARRRAPARGAGDGPAELDAVAPCHGYQGS